MGFHDVDDVPPDPANPIMRRWAKLRIKWLDRIGWPDWALARLKRDLDLTREQILEAAK
jgi:hypothetical protein